MDFEKRKPILVIGGQGVGKTTKAREIAGIKPGQEADKLGQESAFNIDHGVASFHYQEFANFRIVDEINSASKLISVWKKAKHSSGEFTYIAIVQTGTFRLTEGIEDYFEIIDLGPLQDAPRVENNRRFRPYPGPPAGEVIFFATSNEAEPVFTKSDLEKAYLAGGGAFRSFDHFFKSFRK